MKILPKVKKGFTLIELLIVIAVLGILAVAVLSAINPIEQINRSRDTGSRSDAEQLISAVDRFYASKGYYPWQTGEDDVANTNTGWTAVDNAWLDSGAVPVLDNLSTSTGELKESFVDRISKSEYNTLFVYNGGNQGDSTYVCFNAKSGSFTDDSSDRCSGTTPDDYPGGACANATDCIDDEGNNCSCLP